MDFILFIFAQTLTLHISSLMGCSASSDMGMTAPPTIQEPEQGGRRKCYNTGGNVFPRSARGRKIQDEATVMIICQLWIYQLESLFF